MSGRLFEVMSDIEEMDRENLYLLMVHYINSQNEFELLASLKQRESEGNIAIAEHVILPHLESDLIDESKILIIRLRNSVNWNSKIGEVKLIISIFLKKDESKNIQQKIASYMRKLADEDYLEYLINTDELDLSTLKLE